MRVCGVSNIYSYYTNLFIAESEGFFSGEQWYVSIGKFSRRRFFSNLIHIFCKSLSASTLPFNNSVRMCVCLKLVLIYVSLFHDLFFGFQVVLYLMYDFQFFFFLVCLLLWFAKDALIEATLGLNYHLELFYYFLFCVEFLSTLRKMLSLWVWGRFDSLLEI